MSIAKAALRRNDCTIEPSRSNALTPDSTAARRAGRGISRQTCSGVRLPATLVGSLVATPASAWLASSQPSDASSSLVGTARSVFPRNFRFFRDASSATPLASTSTFGTSAARPQNPISKSSPSSAGWEAGASEAAAAIDGGQIPTSQSHRPPNPPRHLWIRRRQRSRREHRVEQGSKRTRAQNQIRPTIRTLW